MMRRRVWRRRDMVDGGVGFAGPRSAVVVVLGNVERGL